MQCDTLHHPRLSFRCFIKYQKSNILYGLHYAKEAIRSTKKVIMVEGYFDVIACHRVEVENVVAVSGTALTEQHVKILKRFCDTVVLCLDQDRAGQDGRRGRTVHRGAVTPQ